MAKSLAQFAADIRGNIAKGKLKPARKAFEKAQKSGATGPQLAELELELFLAEEGGAAAAKALKSLAVSTPTRIVAGIKSVETHLRKVKDDHVLRDALWEICLETAQYDHAIRQLQTLVEAKAVDGNKRAQSMLGRKDAVGAAGIFLLTSVGAVKTDRVKLADKMLTNEQGAQLLAGLCETLHAQGNEESEIHYVLAQVAKKRGDKEGFLQHAGKAFDEDPAGVWTNTMADQSSTDRLEFALAKNSLKYLLQASSAAKPNEIVDAAQKSKGEGTPARTVRGFALLHAGKPANACRVLEGLVAEDAAAAAPIAEFLAGKADQWAGAREAFAAVAAAGLASDATKVTEAAGTLLQAAADERGDAWGRVAPVVLGLAPGQHDLRRELGLYLLGQGEHDEAAALLSTEEHVSIARAWAEAGAATGPVLLKAAELAEEHGLIADNAEWMLNAAKGDGEVLAVLGARLSAAAVSLDTAMQSAQAMLDQGQSGQAAVALSHLPLDEETGKAVEALMRERTLLDDRDFQVVSFRCALALGDLARARRLFPKIESNVQILAEQAGRHAAAGRVLADVLIAAQKGEIAVTLLDKRRDAGDDARTLLPLADALVKGAPQLAMGRLVRAKLLHALDREADAVRDLRAISAGDPQVDEVYQLLGELAENDRSGSSVLGRADIDIARKKMVDAIRLLNNCPAEAAERLQRFDTIAREDQDRQAGHHGRATCLLELGRVPEAAEAHFRRFACRDADPASVAGDLEGVAKAALDKGDIPTASAILEKLPDCVSDGAERAIRVIGDDQRASMLILRSKLFLGLGRAEEAVSALSSLVRADKESRPQAAKALEAIVESGQARPEVDFALADAYESMQMTPKALGALQRLYGDDITSKDKVIEAAQKLVLRADDADVRLFLGSVSLDMRNPRLATEHAIAARRLRPAARRDCVTVLQRALDQDAFAPETHFALAEAHLAGDEADDAVRHFRAAVEVDKSRASAAITAIEEAAPRSKHSALLWLAVGTTYAEFSKNHRSAVDAYTKGLGANPTTELRVPLLLGRGDAHAALQANDKAFDDFDEASQHDLLERRYYEFLRARHRQRVLEAAEEASAKADKSFAHAAEACSRFIRLGRYGEAVSIAQKALAQASDAVGPRYLVGVTLHAAGRYDAAVQVLETVRTAAGAGLAVGRAARMLLAESYLDSGDRVKARACLTEIEAVDSSYPGLKTRRAALAPPADDPHAPPPLFVRPEFPRPTE